MFSTNYFGGFFFLGTENKNQSGEVVMQNEGGSEYVKNIDSSSKVKWEGL